MSDSVLKSEFENPKDPEIKAALAVTYWCAGQIGLAYEHWLWLVQFEAQSVRGIQAKNYVETLHQNSSSRLPISCPQ